jgi:hypothetical protein
MEIDKRFNRIQTQIDNFYIPTYGKNTDMTYCHLGKVKCKLIHSKDDSVVFPDQIFIATNGNDFKWIQPFTFLVNLLIKDGEIINCSFFVDISAGNTLKIEFTNKDIVTNLLDHSSIFNCKIYGPENLLDYCTGEGRFIGEIPYLKLYHHTLPSYKELILKTSTIRLSNWNIQGTKKLTNIGYFYLTCLDTIMVDNDLKQIAMSSDGAIHLLLDNYVQPRFISEDAVENIKNGILELKVYRESTKNRKATIEFLVDSSLLAPKHLWKHYPNDNAVFYEVCMPFIFRIGGNIGKTFSFEKLTITNQEKIKILDYQIVGIGTNFKGLEAPYNEENTEHIFKIEKLTERTNILDFWFENTNSDQYSNKPTEKQEFEIAPPDNV